jgi:hypothetical protein
LPFTDAALRFAQYAFIRWLTTFRAAALIRGRLALGRGRGLGEARRPLSPDSSRTDRIPAICRSSRRLSRLQGLGWTFLGRGPGASIVYGWNRHWGPVAKITEHPVVSLSVTR